MTGILITSFGYGHAPPPEAHLTVDVRHLFRDPHTHPAMRNMTGHDKAVVRHVLGQPGATRFAYDLADIVSGLSIVHDTVRLAIGCAGGRHRSVVLANAVADRLTTHGYTAGTVLHRDIDKPVLQRK